MDINHFTSGSVFHTFSGLLLTPAVAKFAAILSAREGCFNTLVACFLPALAEILTEFLKKYLILLLV